MQRGTRHTIVAIDSCERCLEATGYHVGGGGNGQRAMPSEILLA